MSECFSLSGSSSPKPRVSVWLVSMRAPCRATVVRAFARRWPFTPGAWPNRATPTFTLKETVRRESGRGQGTGVARPVDGRSRYGFGPGRDDIPTDRQRCQRAQVLSASGQRHTATARCRTARDRLAGQLHADPHDNAAILGRSLEHRSASKGSGKGPRVLRVLRGIWLRLSTTLNDSCSGGNQGSETAEGGDERPKISSSTLDLGSLR